MPLKPPPWKKGFISGRKGHIHEVSWKLPKMILHGRIHQAPLYIGRSDVAVYMATIRSPFCGYNTIMRWATRIAIQITLNQKNEKMSIWSLTYQQSVFKRYHSDKHFSDLNPQDGGKISWHRYGTKLRHCHRMHTESARSANRMLIASGRTQV